jgi:hypothetical protein
MTVKILSRSWHDLNGYIKETFWKRIKFKGLTLPDFKT